MRISDWSSDVCSSDLLNDTELLASARTEALLAQLEQGAPGRILILDSPPVLAASPAAVLAGHVGQLIMVVRADETLESALRDAIGLMGACPHIQLLLNGVKYSRSEEHTSELQSLMRHSYAVFCLKKKKQILTTE